MLFAAAARLFQRGMSWQLGVLTPTHTNPLLHPFAMSQKRARIL